MIDSNAIIWPAVASYLNQPELETVESALELGNLSGTAPFTLIDHAGNRFKVQLIENDLQTTMVKPIDIDHLLTLAREHMAALDHCCVSKFRANSTAEIIDALVQLGE